MHTWRNHPAAFRVPLTDAVWRARWLPGSTNQDKKLLEATLDDRGKATTKLSHLLKPVHLPAKAKEKDNMASAHTFHLPSHAQVPHPDRAQITFQILELRKNGDYSYHSCQKEETLK